MHELGPLLGLLVKHGQQLGQGLAHGRRLVVRDAVEREQRAAPYLEVGRGLGLGLGLGRGFRVRLRVRVRARFRARLRLRLRLGLGLRVRLRVRARAAP